MIIRMRIKVFMQYWNISSFEQSTLRSIHTEALAVVEKNQIQLSPGIPRSWQLEYPSPAVAHANSP